MDNGSFEGLLEYRMLAKIPLLSKRFITISNVKNRLFLIAIFSDSIEFLQSVKV